jgi:hypothetical protein
MIYKIKRFRGLNNQENSKIRKIKIQTNINKLKMKKMKQKILTSILFLSVLFGAQAQ